MATPIVIINDSLNAIVDGSDFGKVGDVIVNNKNNAALVVAVNVALMAKLTAIQSEKTTAIAAKEVEKQAALTAKAAAETAKAVEVARVGAIVTALKGVAPGTLPAAVAQAILTEAEKKTAALVAQKTALLAQVAAADVELAATTSK